MKYVIITVIVLGVILGGITLKPNVQEFTAPAIAEVIEREVEKEVEVDALEKAIQEAQDAKRSEIEAIAQAAHDEAYNQEMKKVELQVIKDFGAKLESRQIELEKETNSY